MTFRKGLYSNISVRQIFTLLSQKINFLKETASKPLSAHGSAQTIHQSQNKKHCQDLHGTCCTQVGPPHVANTLVLEKHVLTKLPSYKTFKGNTEKK